MPFVHHISACVWAGQALSQLVVSRAALEEKREAVARGAGRTCDRVKKKR